MHNSGHGCTKQYAYRVRVLKYGTFLAPVGEGGERGGKKKILEPESKEEKKKIEPGRPRPTVCAIPITSPDEDRQKALDSANVQGLLDSSNKRDKWGKPEGGKFTKVEDLDGVSLAGTPEDIVEGVEKFVQSGLNHLVFDLRMRFDDWDYCLDLLGQDILPNCPR